MDMEKIFALTEGEQDGMDTELHRLLEKEMKCVRDDLCDRCRVVMDELHLDGGELQGKRNAVVDELNQWGWWNGCKVGYYLY